LVVVAGEGAGCVATGVEGEVFDAVIDVEYYALELLLLLSRSLLLRELMKGRQCGGVNVGLARGDRLGNRGMEWYG
jgi:hypothetical protein